ncbi:MAG: type II toxin-antitoxin system RelE/ParE family toxin [Nitrospirae bacterium]|nr:type II toxin-antitoxin system RelE/ParE family toxin [Nitrospirota bacterium]
MKFVLEFRPRVVKDFKKLDVTVQRLVQNALAKIASSPEIGKPLKPPFQGMYSVRAGSYRIIYEVHNEIITVLIVAIGHRREVYDKLRNLL